VPFLVAGTKAVKACVAERSESGFLLGNRRQYVEKVARGSRQAVEPRHHEHVAGVELVEDAAKLDAIGLRAGRGAKKYDSPQQGVVDSRNGNCGISRRDLPWISPPWRRRT
jgi:hypothetical protein